MPATSPRLPAALHSSVSLAAANGSAAKGDRRASPPKRSSKKGRQSSTKLRAARAVPLGERRFSDSEDTLARDQDDVAAEEGVVEGAPEETTLDETLFDLDAPTEVLTGADLDGALGEVEEKKSTSATDTMLARYFREMATHSVMGQEAELEIAIAVESAEIAHWVAIFDYLPTAAIALASLEADLPTGEEALSLPQLAELKELLAEAEKQGFAVSKEFDKKWRAVATSLAKAIRLPDSDRLWILHAEQAVRDAGEPPDTDDGPPCSAPAPRCEALPPSSVEVSSAGEPVDATEGEELQPDTAPPRPRAPRISARGRVEPTAAYRRALSQISRASLASKRVKNNFVKANLRLVVSIARRYNRGRMPLIDLIQEGNIGLMKAVERFDHARGYRFSTYASWWIRHAISRAIADKGRAVRIPVHMLDTHNRIQRATQAVLARTGRDPSLDDLEKETGIPQDKLDKAQGAWTDTPFSLDRPVGDEDGRRFIDFLQDENGLSPDDALANQTWSDEVRRLLTLLTPIEARILRWRFGLDDEDELTLKEIGDKYNLSRERIRQLQEQALSKIRKHMRD